MGEPDDVVGECNAHCYIADNFGDNHATMRCALPAGHEGQHCEKFTKMDEGACVVLWERDGRTDR